MIELTRIACEKVSLGIIYFQEVISIYDNKRYLLSLNIILDNKIIHKIRYDKDELPYEIGIGKRIAKEFITKKLSQKKEHRKSKMKSKYTVNKTAARETASNLFSEIEAKNNS